MQLKINFSKGNISFEKKKSITTAIEKTFRKLAAKSSWQVNLAFVDEDYSKKLNKQFAGNNYPTDVLSFNYQENNDPGLTENHGDIVICKPIALKQAKQNNISVAEELIRLSVHATLHLLGFDHGSKLEQTRFFDLQNDIINSLN